MPHLFERELPAVLGQADNLPSLPAVALEVLRLSQDENASLDELASCLSRDPALAAKLLKLANSSLFGVGREVTTLQRAVVLLGIKTVKLMALSFSLVSSLPRKGRQGAFDFTEYWRRSLVSAISARSLARLVRNPHADEAFLCGLFQHFGKLVLARCFGAPYTEVLQQTGGWPAPAIEERLLGFSSSDVCATLLKNWNLPEVIYVAVGYCSRPEAAPSDLDDGTRRLIEVLSLTACIETVLCDQEKGAALSRLHVELEQRFQLSPAEVDAFLVGLESGIAETAELLSIQIPAGKGHEELLGEARLQMVSLGLGTAVELARAERRNETLEEEKHAAETRARTDQLTGLPNRRAFDEFLERQVHARLRERLPRGLGLLLIDVDRFKKFNDAHGHQIGDEVLRLVAEVLGKGTRKGDFTARYGGEEFAVILPQNNKYGLKSAAERLRRAIEQAGFEHDGRRLSVTVSLGGACIGSFASAGDAQALIQLADHFLYRAKENGRNRSEIYPREDFPPR